MTQLGMIGLGKMGGNMTERLLGRGVEVVVWDRAPEAVQRVAGVGAAASADLADLVRQLEAPRLVWVMVPAGAPVDATIDGLLPLLTPGDVVIDGGNSNFHDTRRRAERLAAQGFHLVDAGTSGGVWGKELGYCLMVGGDPAAVKRLEPVLTALAPDQGWRHVGPAGAGHFVKMVHNGIEYGLLQAYAEGYEILRAAPQYPGLDLAGIAELWQQGSVVRSWLNELAARAFARSGDLADVKGWVADSGEGRWTVQAAIDSDVPAPVITLALQMRFRSRQEDSFSAKVIAALRNEFGGHEVKRA
jgi:6-phosphogluconate dehydrogenase